MPHVLPVGGGSERKEFGIAPPGLHQAVCVDFVDVGKRPNKFEPGTSKHECYLVWQVVPYDDEGQELLNNAGERFRVRKYFTYSLHEKSNLYKALVAWRGKPFSPEEKAFDVEHLIGANCQLQIVHGTKADGSPVARINNIVPLLRGMQKLEPLDYVREQDRISDGGQEDLSEVPF